MSASDRTETRLETAPRITLLDPAAARAQGMDSAGGKGWQLARMAHYALPVPDFRVLPAAAALAAVEATGLDADAADAGDDPAALAAVAAALSSGEPPAWLQAVVDAVLALPGFDRPLAVRSSARCEDSATASFAGIHDSKLNVPPDAPAVCAAVRAVWASAWSAHAQAYRRRLGLDWRAAALAVVVMPLVPARAAGVAFSCDPQTGATDVIVIEAVTGLGEALVGGQVEPDRWRLRLPAPGHAALIADTRIGRKERRVLAAPEGGTLHEAVADGAARPALAAADVLALAALVQRSAQALAWEGPPLDIEWALDADGRFRLLQARPVTALPRELPPALAGLPAFWSNGNFRDAIPMVQTPLDWSIAAPLIEATLGTALPIAGWRPPVPQPRARLYQGRAYMAVTRMAWEFFEALGFPPARFDALTGGHQPVWQPPARVGLMTKLARGWRLFRLMRALLAIRRRADALFARSARQVARWRSHDWANADDAAIAGALQTIADEVMGSGETGLRLLLTSGGGSLEQLGRWLEPCVPGRGDALAQALVAGLGAGTQGNAITSAGHAEAIEHLATLAALETPVRTLLGLEGRDGRAARRDWRRKLPPNSPFALAFDDFLARWGHRAVYEVSVRTPRWREDPEYLFGLIRDRVQAADAGTPMPDTAARRRALAERAGRELCAAVPAWKRGLMRATAAAALQEAAQREQAKSALTAWLEPLRAALAVIGPRLVERGVLRAADDPHFLTLDELRAVLDGRSDGRGLAALVADRRATHEACEALAAVDLLVAEGATLRPATDADLAVARSRPAQTASAAAAAGDGTQLIGLGVAAGRAQGRARHVRHPDEGGRLAPGEVLLAPSTDPAWTPLFPRAAAIVLETGGFLSHGAIVAREFGVPAVVNVAQALARIADGCPVDVDGDRGRVTLSGPPAAAPEPAECPGTD